MASIKLYFDTRRAKKDDTYPLKLKLFHKDKARYIPLNFFFKKNQWIIKDHKVNSSFPNSGRVNASIRKLLAQATVALSEMGMNLNSMSIDELKEIISQELFGNSSNSPDGIKEISLFSYFRILITRLKESKKFGSADSYRDAFHSFKKFLGDKDIQLSEIDHSFLMEYQRYCQNRGLKTNSIGVYLRTLRATINKAIDEGVMSSENYAFQKFKIKKESTDKRAISKEEINKIINLKVKKETRLWHSQNYFVFMFNMRGMNFIDLAYLTSENIQKDRIIYRRAKTGKLYNIKLTEKAQSIINHYHSSEKGKTYVFPILPKEVWGNPLLERERFKNRRKYFNKDLKKLGEMAGINVNLTSYVSRHTWASIAKFSGVAPAIIGESLGHSDLKTTETYLANFDHDVLDDANDLIVG